SRTTHLSKTRSSILQLLSQRWPTACDSFAFDALPPDDASVMSTIHLTGLFAEGRQRPEQLDRQKVCPHPHLVVIEKHADTCIRSRQLRTFNRGGVERFATG
ncbi:MAG: hypothetical protein ABJC87_18740, partial [Roseobacter sp.]